MTARGLLLFIARRLVALVVLLFIISFGVFSLLYIAPGSVDEILLGLTPSTPEAREAIREAYNLNDPFLVQYWKWLEGALHLDFGRSIRTSEPVLQGIKERMELSVVLGLLGFLIAVVVGVPLGILAAVRKRSTLDRAVVGLSVVGVSAPAFATGIFLLCVFSVWLGWFPAFGQGEGLADALFHLALPALALSLTAMALILKLTRAAMITALEQDYITFARSRGVSPPRTLVSYALRNALVPVVTGAGLVLGHMLAGSVLVETTFALPGIGSLLVDSVEFKDIPMLQGITMMIAFLIIMVNLLTDILYVFIDPRIQFGKGSN